MNPQTFTYYDNDNGVKVMVIDKGKKWDVEVWDLDTDMKVGARVFKNLEEAKAYAVKCANQ